MAIAKVGTWVSPPEDIDDYDAIVAHLSAFTKQCANQAMILSEWANTTTTPAILLGSYISHGGVLYQVQTEDFAVTTPASDGTYYLKVAASGASLALSWVTSLTGYSWNGIYNGLYDVSENQILPYQVVVTGTATVFAKRKILNPWNITGFQTIDYLGAFGNVTASAIVCTTIDTGNGALEVYKNTVGSFNGPIGEDTTYTIPAMNTYETRVISVIGTNEFGSAYNFTIKAPSSGGPFYVVMSGSASVGGIFSGGATIYTVSVPDSTTVTYGIIIRRST